MQNLSAKNAKLVMDRALKHGGRQGFTAVKRVFARELGASYRKLPGQLQARPAPSFGHLSYTNAHGRETNVSMFGAKKRAKGVSAAPWRKRRVFKSTFFIGGNVYARTSKARGPVKQIWGPNLARELHRDYTSSAFFLAVKPAITRRLDHEMTRELAKLNL